MHSFFWFQTIIECLKYSTSGELPPGSKGGAFVHDPKVTWQIPVNSTPISKLSIRLFDFESSEAFSYSQVKVELELSFMK